MVLVIWFKVAVSQLSAALKRPTPDVVHSSLGCFPASGQLMFLSVNRILHRNQPEKVFYQTLVSDFKRMKKLQCLHG